jgi:hypothetical protein
LRIAGRMLDRHDPPAKGSLEATGRLQALLHELGRSPYVRVAEEAQRFDTSQPGFLKFELVLATDPARPL